MRWWGLPRADLGRPNDSSGCWSAVRSWGSVGACCLAVAELSWAQPCLSRFQLVRSPAQRGRGRQRCPARSQPAFAGSRAGGCQPARRRACSGRPSPTPAPGAHRTARPGPGAAASLSPRPERSGQALPALGKPLAPSAAVTGGADPAWALGLASTCLRARAGPNAPSSGPAPCGLCAAAIPALFIYMLYIFIYYGRRAQEQQPGSAQLAPALAPPSCRGRAASELGPAAAQSWHRTHSRAQPPFPAFSFAQFAAIAPSSFSSSSSSCRGGFSQVGSGQAALAPILPAGTGEKPPRGRGRRPS